MDFSLSDVDEALVKGIGELDGRLLHSEVIARDAAGTFSRAAWRELAAAGLTGLPVPEEYGGRGASAVSTVAVLAELGRVCTDNGLMFSLGAHLWACTDPIAQHGDDAQRKHWLPGLCDGSLIGAHATTEPEAGSDAAAIGTTAVPDGDGWLLNGTKTFITNAPVADVFLVTAVTEPSRGWLGLSAFLVPAGTPGLTVGPVVEKSGLRTAPMADVVMADCRVGPEALLGAPGAGMPIFTAAMVRERTFILAPALGVLARLADRCAEYAAGRRQFGAPIADFQSVSNRLAEMRLRAHTARLLTFWAAWLTDHKQVRPEHAAMVKLHVAEALLASALDAVQVHGGAGFTTGLELERMVRDAMGARLYSGTTDIQRNVISHAATHRRRG